MAANADFGNRIWSPNHMLEVRPGSENTVTSLDVFLILSWDVFSVMLVGVLGSDLIGQLQ